MSAAFIAAGGIAAAFGASFIPPTLGAVGAPTAAALLVATFGALAAAASRPRLQHVAAAAVSVAALVALVISVSTGVAVRAATHVQVGGLTVELLEVGPLTALSLLFIAAALATAGRDVAEPLVAVPVAIGYVVLVGHLFGARELSSLMTTWSAVATVSLSLAIVATSDQTRWMRIVTASSPAGFTARRLVLVALVAPLAFAWLRLIGQRQGLYGTELGIAMYTVSVTAALLAVIYLTATRIDDADRLRRRHERELQEAEAKFRTLLERSPDGMIVVDRGGAIRLVNSGVETLFGYSRDELLGRDVSLLVADALRHGETAQIRTTGLRKNGTKFAAEVALSPIESREGPVVLASVRDVSARKAMEDALRRSEAILSDTQQVSKVGGWQFELATGKVEWTEEVYRIHDLSPAEYDPGDAERDLAFYAPEERQKITDAFSRAITHGEPYDLELRMITATGRPIFVRTVARIDWADGKVSRVYGYIIDVTARRQAEAAIRAAHAEAQMARDRLKAIIDNIRDPIAAMDAEHRFIALNQAYAAEFSAIFGTVPAAGASLVDLLAHLPDEREKALAVWDRALGGEEYQTIHEFGDAARERRVYELSYSCLREGTPDVTGAILAARDVTARVRAEEALARKTADLQRSNQELEQFAYVASHDLQEPLRMVSSYTQLLARRYRDRLDQDANDFIDFAVDGANRMQCLINDLLLYSRVGTKGRELAPIDSHVALGKALANLRVSIADAGALVTNDDLPPVIADETQLTQLFQNLIGNGIKFRRPDEPPRIHVAASRDGARWTFSVADNGIGIAPQFRSRVFAIFQRLHTREQYPGTGIGLAICKRIVERHGGRIWIESTPGAGSTFHFTLAAAEGDH